MKNKILAHVFASAMGALASSAFGDTPHLNYYRNEHAPQNQGSKLRRRAGRTVDDMNFKRLVDGYANRAVVRPIEVGQRVEFNDTLEKGAGIVKGTVTEILGDMARMRLDDGITIQVMLSDLTAIDEVNIPCAEAA